MGTVVIMRRVHLPTSGDGHSPFRSTIPIGVINSKRAPFWISRIEARIRTLCREARTPTIEYQRLNHCPNCGKASKRAQLEGQRICSNPNCRYLFTAADDPFTALNLAPLVELDDIFENEALVREMLIQNLWPHYHCHPVKGLTL